MLEPIRAELSALKADLANYRSQALYKSFVELLSLQIDLAKEELTVISTTEGILKKQGEIKALRDLKSALVDPGRN